MVKNRIGVTLEYDGLVILMGFGVKSSSTRSDGEEEEEQKKVVDEMVNDSEWEKNDPDENADNEIDQLVEYVQKHTKKDDIEGDIDHKFV